MRTKNAYSKPIMALEKFTPQEYVATCVWQVNINPLPFDKAFSRIDINHNGRFDIEWNSNNIISYTERGFDLIDTTQHTFSEGQYEIVDVNVYKYIGSQIGESEENGHYYSNGDYRLVATRMLKSKWGLYYYIGAEGQSVSEIKNQS